ncbi:probable dolichyl-diphosphooligosaccharide--protein glycosyltransferase subunit 3B [Macadamia integrifolia]|uniref:probable dolichyl-diphosphooligosaccharide--protein glycosyltransferase subunit 3B n=1 Tax=Macadamia integrifolia TaxID=60698 RepID=UPI001C4F9167|nr:probable dolichyl-diphosphooligosaccharide--protein glycosyltransferase subunit 3B [Macadamia integrifolia]
MAILGKPSLRIHVLLFVAFYFSFANVKVSSESDADRVDELLSLQSISKSGVIHLDDHSLRRFITSAKPRSYSLVIFFDAVQLHDKHELHLQELRAEFDLVASTFIKNNKDIPAQSKLFFCVIEFKESQSSFALFAVNTLPHVRHVGPQIQNLKDSESMDQNDFARIADSMAEFVEAKTSLTVGPIERPPLLSKKQLGFLLTLTVIWAPFIVKRLLVGDTLLQSPRLWVLFAVFVYFLSVSGTMHNIIRKMPMFLADRNDPSKLIFFYQGSEMQLGAESFAVGFLYTAVGLLLAFTTHLLVRVRNVTVQRVFMIIALLVSLWAVKKVIYLDNWKTGYGVHGFWPSSWKLR